MHSKTLSQKLTKTTTNKTSHTHTTNPPGTCEDKQSTCSKDTLGNSWEAAAVADSMIASSDRLCTVWALTQTGLSILGKMNEN